MLQRNTKILWRELDGETVLLHPQAGFSYNLNVVGTMIWKMLDGQHTTEDIALAICTAYEVETIQATHDIEQLLIELKGHQLVLEI